MNFSWELVALVAGLTSRRAQDLPKFDLFRARSRDGFGLPHPLLAIIALNAFSCIVCVSYSLDGVEPLKLLLAALPLHACLCSDNR